VHALLLIALLAIPSNANGQTQYETPPVLRAADLVPQALLSGPHHRLDEPVPTDGFLATFQVHSDFGDFQVRSLELLAARIHELGAIAELQEIENNEEFVDGLRDSVDETSEAPIIKLVNHIFSQAVKSQASDIHIEPYQQHLQVRFRLDGVLHSVLSPPRRLHAAIVSRIKVMARLDIAEKRLPQDGRTEVKIGERLVDVRVSCLPTAFGERVVLRLLEKSGKLLSMEEIGFTAAALAEMKRLLHLSHGIILVTGPTGSGKTTSLYAALSSINSPDKNILTIEDPIEYQLDGIGQMQVNPKINLTFASGLRSMVRQDPDVILVGEIRDRETADIAIHAALTGHLVFSTLHTNDSASAVTRLTDMGIEPFLVSTAVQAIIAQRLVRLLCTHCKEAYEPEEAQWAELRSSREVAGPIFRADGCEKCLETGYRGRTGIYEFLLLSEAIKGLVLKTSDANQINKVARAEGMASLREDGINKVMEGRTTISEVLRVTQL